MLRRRLSTEVSIPRSWHSRNERCPTFGGNQFKASAVDILYNTARQSEPNAPATRFCGHAGLEQRVPHFNWNPGSVVCDGEPCVVPLRLHLNGDVTASSAQCIDRIADQRLKRPLDKHRISIDRRA